MSKIIPITILSLILAAVSHHNSGYDPINCRYAKKERMFYVLMAIALILFAGLRTSYNDTGTYRRAYSIIPDSIGLTEGIDWFQIGKNPGFVFTMRVMRRLNVSTQSFLMLFSVFTVSAYLWFFRKYSCNLFLTVMLFITFAGYTFTLAAIKQCTAMALCLIGTDRAIRKKYLPFLLYVLVACLFHPYALMYLVVPFLFFRPWSKYTVIMIVIFGLLGVGMQFLVGSLLSVTDMLGSSYNASSFTGEGVNPIRLIVVSVPTILSLLTVEQIAESEERDQYLILNLTMLNAEIMFVGLFGTANYFARLANYFLPFQAVSIPWLFRHFDYDGRKSLTMVAAVCYVLFFIYSTAISESFDLYYASMPFWDYVKSLFS